MRDLNLLELVSGVVRRYLPIAREEEHEELQKRQAAIRGATWLSWFFECCEKWYESTPSNVSFPQEAVLHKYVNLLRKSQALPSTEEQLCKEFRTLHEFGLQVSSSLSCQTWWNMFYGSLQRAFEMILESKSSLHQPSIDGCLSLVLLILLKVSYLKRKSPMLFEPFTCVCCAACRVLLIQRETEKAKSLANTLANLQLQNKENGDVLQGVFESGLGSREYVYLTAFCCGALSPKESLQLLNEVDNASVQPQLNYMRINLLYDCGEYEEAFDASAPLTKDSIFRTLPSYLKPHLCVLVGLCLFKLGRPADSVDWYSKAVDKELSNIVALWHMADAYRSLKNSQAERKALQRFLQGSLNHPVSSNGNISSVSQVGHQEALYIAASRLHQAGFFEEATEQFTAFMRENRTFDLTEWVLVPKPSLAQVYVEAAHAFFHAKAYDESLRLVRSVLLVSPDSKQELERNLFRMVNGYHVCDKEELRGRARNNDVSSVRSTSCFALLLQTVLTMQLKPDKQEEAEKILRRILSVASLLDREERTESKSKHDSRELHRQTELPANNLHLLCPPLMRPRQGSKQRCPVVEEGQRSANVKQWQELVSQAYGVQCTLRLKRGLDVDALHSLKASLMAWPGNLDTLFNYVLLLLKLEKRHKALQVWNSAKEKGLLEILQQEESSYWIFNVTLNSLKELNIMLSSF